MHWVELHADQFRDAGFLHGHPVQRLSGFHGALGVGDHDELGLRRHLFQQSGEPLDVGLIERRVHFVQNAERAGNIPEDRHRRGLLLDFTLAENAILGVHYRPPIAALVGNIFLDDNAIQQRANEIIEQFDVRPPNAALPARALSGGNQQKLIIGREYHVNPKLLLVSQPTRGVDIGAIEFIHRKLVKLRDDGCAILLISAELEEVTSLSDRLLVIHEGKIAGEVDPKVATMEEIGLLMTRGH